MRLFGKVIRFKPLSVTIGLMIFFAAFFTVACSDKDDSQTTGSDVTSEDVKEEAKEAVEAAAAYTQQQKEEYLKEINARIDEFNQKIDELQKRAESKASTLGKEARETMDNSMAELQQLKQETEAKYDELIRGDFK